jgi:8-oxo-dGTP pyrophosphatase MutT (NUDIX family)
MIAPFQRHIDACNNAILPGNRTSLRIAGELVGWADPAIATLLRSLPAITSGPGGLTLHEPAALPAIARSFAERGLYRFRNEAFDVRAQPGGRVLSTIDRGALPAFGVMAEGVHLNGLVKKPEGLHVWVARRAADKALDPGKLDHLAAGGVSAGMGAWDTLIKECAEEASIPGDLVRQAIKTAEISYNMDRPEGLRRDVLQCYDLYLPEDFVPIAADGEVESFALWPIERAYTTVRDTDDFKFNINLVLINLFARLGMPV